MRGSFEGALTPDPKRRPTVVVDFDGTIAHDDDFPNIGEPMPGVAAALTSLMDAGYDVVVFTCRMYLGDGRPREEAARHKELIAEWMRSNGIPFTRVEEGLTGKPRADWYIDNKGLHYGGGDDWARLAAFIVSKK